LSFHQFDELSWEEMNQSGFNFARAAEISFLGAHGGNSISTDKEKEVPIVNLN
jgi:hypothetical protein